MINFAVGTATISIRAAGSPGILPAFSNNSSAATAAVVLSCLALSLCTRAFNALLNHPMTDPSFSPSVVHAL